jgi:Cys-rich protein (TIGR01571 family)
MCDCLDDGDALCTCIFSTCCPCVVVGNIFEDSRLGKFSDGCCKFFGSMFVFACCCVGGGIRANLRTKYHIDGNDCVDCILHIACIPCLLTQETREITYRNSEPGPANMQMM